MTGATPWKLRLLLALMASSPREFLDRLRAVFEVNLDRRFHAAPDYPAMPWHTLLSELSGALRVDAAALDREVDAHGLETMVADGIARLGTGPALALRHNADTRIARFCYIACRAMRPRTVIETGVAYGVTSVYILKALHLNASGHLYSVDLPPLGANADAWIGHLVPRHLRSRWTLHRGASRRVLPPLLATVGPVDLFVHDSLHTFRNMRSEFAAVHRHRADPFVLIADDIESNRAFNAYGESAGPAVMFRATWAGEVKRSRAGVYVVTSLARG